MDSQKITWMLLAVKSNGCLLCGSDYTDDKEVVMAAVRNRGYALQFASPRLKEDKEVVLAALRNAGSAIQFASPTLQKDPDVIKASFKNNMYALFCDHVRNNKELVLAAVVLSIIFHVIICVTVTLYALH